jgi:hypothetical protein
MVAAVEAQGVLVSLTKCKRTAVLLTKPQAGRGVGGYLNEVLDCCQCCAEVEIAVSRVIRALDDLECRRWSDALTSMLVAV